MKITRIYTILKVKRDFSPYGYAENKKFEKNNIKKEYAKRYLLKYIRELKMHFDLDENEIKEIMRQIYYTKSSIYPLIKSLSKFFKEKR